MATSWTFNTHTATAGTLQFSLSTCKCFSSPILHNLQSSSHAFTIPSPKQILPSNLSLFFLVKPPVTVIHAVHNIPLSSLNCNSSTETLDFRSTNQNPSSGYDSNEKKQRAEKEKFRDSGKSRKNGARINLWRRNEMGSENKRAERKMEETIGEFPISNDDGYSRGELGSEKNEMIDFGKNSEKGSGPSSSKSNNRKGRRKIVGNIAVNNDGHSSSREFDSEHRGHKGSWVSSKKAKADNSATIVVNGENVHGQTIKHNKSNNDSKVKKQKKSKKKNPESPEFQLRVGLDMCSKMGDVMGAISLYDSAVQRGVNMGQYHYTVLLYLCSSAAMGVIRPAKSGSGSRSLERAPQDLDGLDDSDEEGDTDDTDDEALDIKDQSQKIEVNEIRVSDEVKKYALDKGFEIYERMCMGKVQMNEAALTSVARLAMAMGDGDMAFDTVKQMKSMGIIPKLRSYGPALSVFSSSGELDRAFSVEEHMLENGVHPEEPELEALLRVSIQTGKADRVYSVLQKLRTTVRAVSPSTADYIEKWFMSKEASRVGKRKWDHKMIAQMMQNVGGGWHGQGWLGRGKWTVSRASVGADGLCQCCGEKLALIDLDPEETERFAESVASIALKREKNSNFQKFQRWLEYYGPFEAVVDAANVGLYSQRKFKPSKVNVVVNGIRQKLSSKKWPLIVLHNKRVTGSKMEQPINRALLERWRNADALYATPTGSNDDWYWLYAAIKYKCLLVTNDEMRDHTFQLLGNDFFPKWKERHQVRFSFSEIGPVFHMPPPCSVVIQESDRGYWHIPVASEHQSEGDRIWLCITRPNLLVMQRDPEVGANLAEDSQNNLKDKKQVRTSNSLSHSPAEVQLVAHSKQGTKELVPKGYRKPRNTLSESVSSNSDGIPVWNAIKAAEELGGWTIDFQI